MRTQELYGKRIVGLFKLFKFNHKYKLVRSF